jgi:hypothetical protein
LDLIYAFAWDNKVIFPNIDGWNLRKENINLPNDLKGEYNLLIISFRHSQHILIEQWFFFLKMLEKEFPQFRSYEIPTFGRLYKIIKPKIEKGMVSKIKHLDFQERIINIFLNKSRFKKNLAISKENTIYLFLVDKRGAIHWSTFNGFSNQKIEELSLILKALFN